MSCCTSHTEKPHDMTTSHPAWTAFEPTEEVFSYCLRCLQICVHIPFLDKSHFPPRRVMLWQLAASCLAFAHVVLGTLILSSLIFVGFHDTLVILVRFLASAVVSRVTMLVQLNDVKTRMDDGGCRMKG